MLNRFWKWVGTFFAGLIAGLLLYLGIRSKSMPGAVKQGTKQATDDANKAIDAANAALDKSKEVIAHSEATLEEVRKRRKARQEKAAKLDSGAGKLLTIILLALLVGLYTGAVQAQDSVPESYEDLRAAYLNQVQVAAQWKQLYEEAEQDNITLEHEIETLQSHIKSQDELIASLRDTIAELKAWIAELYKTIANLSKSGLKMTVGALIKTDNGKLSANGVIVGVTWP